MPTSNTEKVIAENVGATRPPIVVVLGHVDHGKSSLLEAIREDFKITSKESGGITQHIGAYEAEYQGKKITFIDTPGHELFSAMRSRGARVADVAILVVAADESVKPQTIEAIEQIKKAEIPMVVAINKADKPEANAQRVKQELAQHEVMVESYGGNVPSVETSATTKKGISELLEMILLVAELEDLSAHEENPGKGVIVESYMDAKRGPTATLLVVDGSIKAGDFVGTSSAQGKIRILEDFQGNTLGKALPSMPAVAIGFLNPPKVGDEFQVFENEQAAQEYRNAQKPPEKRAESREGKTFPIILKADVAGSLEALEDVLVNVATEDIRIQVVEAGVGEVNENDVKKARSSGASIFAFRTKVSKAAIDLAEKEGVVIEKFDVIYELIEAARKRMEKSVEDEGGREDVGVLHVLAVFLVDKTRQVIGGKVSEGEIKKGTRGEIIRGGEVVGQGKVTNVQHDKKDMSSVAKGQECGLSFESKELVQEGDSIQFFIERKPKK